MPKQISCDIPAAVVESGISRRRAITASGPDGRWLGGHIAFAVFLITSVALFWEQLWALASLAYRSDYYSHAIVIPAITGYLLVREQNRIFKEIRTDPLGGIPFLVAGSLVLASREWGVSPGDQQLRLFLAILSIVLIWLGGFTLCYGRYSFRKALFPLLLLGLMVPLPMVVMDGFIHLVRAGSADVASAIFGVLGIPVFRHGFYFMLPGLTIEVAKECSGIHSTLALVVLSLLAGYLFLRSSWKRAFLLLLVVPIVAVTNGLRIATLTLLAEYVDKGILGSSLHRRGGVLFFLLALLLLAMVVRLISKQSGPSTSATRAE